MSDMRRRPKVLRERDTLKRLLYFRERGRCFYCDRSLNIRNATFDHIIPKSQGGVISWENCVIACSPCNNERGDMDAGEFLTLKKQRAGLPVKTNPARYIAIPPPTR